MNVNELEKHQYLNHIILWVTVIFLIVAGAWSYFAIVDEVTVGEGKVIPSSQVQVIQNLEGGILKQIFIKEGDIVAKNQILMQLDDTRFLASVEETRHKIAAFEIKLRRLVAETQKKPFVIPTEFQKKFPDETQTQLALYESRQQELKQLQANYALAKKELELSKPLVSKGAVSPVEVLHLERALSELNSKIINFQSEALDDLTKSRAELSVLKETEKADLDRLTRTTVRSPVKGIIKQIKINTVGGVIKPGMDLLEIVPFEDTLLIEAKIRPKDIGFLHPGQSVTVKITAYDYSIYGELDGKLEQISADTITDEKGNSFYLIRVRTDKNYLSSGNKRLYIIPGMLASVDILTGKKSILSYLIKPFLKAKEQALHER